MEVSFTYFCLSLKSYQFQFSNCRQLKFSVDFYSVDIFDLIWCCEILNRQRSKFYYLISKDEVNTLMGRWSPRRLIQIPESSLHHGANGEWQSSPWENLRYVFSRYLTSKLLLQRCLKACLLSHSYLEVHLCILVLWNGSFQICIAFAASSTFWSAIFSLPVNSQYFLISPVIDLNFFFHKFGDFLLTFSLVSSNLILQYSENIHCSILNLWNVLRHDSWSRIFW